MNRKSTATPEKVNGSIGVTPTNLLLIARVSPRAASRSTLASSARTAAAYFAGSPEVRIARRSDILELMADRNYSDVGGTPGGLGHFLLGLIMFCIGGYLVSHQVSVRGSYWGFYGPSTFGITLIPMLFGIGILFWNGRNAIGWLLTIAGACFILAGVIANMQIYFEPTSLFNTIVMLVLLVGGLGMIARSMASHHSS